MFVGPVFTRELVTAPRRPRLFIFRAVYAAVLFGVMCTAWLVLTGTQVISNVGDMAKFGGILFQLMAPLQLAMVVFFAAMSTASAVSQEKDRKTLILLLLTRLNSSELVLGKLFASLLQVGVMILAGLPIFALVMLFGGVSFQQVGRVFLVTMTTALAAGSLGSTIALWREKTFQTLALTAMVLVFWSLLCEAIRVGAFGDIRLGIEATRLATWLSPIRAILQAARPGADLDTGAWYRTDAMIYGWMALASAVILNGVAIVRVRIWNPSREVHQTAASVTRAQESIWGVEHDDAQKQGKLASSLRTTDDHSAASALESSDSDATVDPSVAMADTEGMDQSGVAGEETAASSLPAAHRVVWDNPILWREACTWAYGRKIIAIRLAYVLLFGFVLAGLVASTALAFEPTPQTRSDTPPQVVAQTQGFLPEFEVTFSDDMVVPETDDGRSALVGLLSQSLRETQSGVMPDTGGLEYLGQTLSSKTILGLGDIALPETGDTRAILEGIAAEIAALPEVAEVQLRTLDRPQQVNDPKFAEQWHYTDPKTGVNVGPTWATTTGKDIVVAVLDTGIRPHEDFEPGRILPGFDFISNTFVANDGDGRDADPSDPGDWIQAGDPFQCGPPQDSSWHGTHVAGTVAATADNNIGLAGVAYDAKILPVRVLGKCGGLRDDIAAGILWAAGLSVPGVPDNPNPAAVINLSLGGQSAVCPTEYQDAIDAAVASGATVIVAAGNANSEVAGFTPANCANVITVAATNRAGGKAFYSNTGALVDIAGPGGETFQTDADGVWSTLNSGTKGPGDDIYAAYQGTSMATPHVAGIAALIHAVNPGIDADGVRRRLIASAKPFPTHPGARCDTSICGAGIADASAILEAAGLSGLAGVTVESEGDVSSALLAADAVDDGWTGVDNFGSIYDPMESDGAEDIWQSNEGTGAFDMSFVHPAEVNRIAALPDLSPWVGPIGPQAIIGTDDRVKVANTTRFPASAQVLVVLPSGRCSGAMIGPDLVITAGHCVHSGGSGGAWQTSATVFPGRNGTHTPFGSCQATRLYSVTGWTENRNPAYDFGAIKLNCDIGARTGWLGYFWRSASLVGFAANISSYPGDKPLEQWAHADQVRSNTVLQTRYQTDTMPGNSGSAVFAAGVPNGCGHCTHTVHAYGGTSFNSGTRITEPLFNNLRRWSDAPKN